MALNTKIPEQILDNSGAVTIKSISDATNSTDSSKVASSKAVKAAYDLANTANGTANNAIPKSKISDAVNSAATDSVASSKAVKTAYDLANGALQANKLSDATNLNSSTNVASSKAVKTAYDLAAAAQSIKITEAEYKLTAKLAAGSSYAVPPYVVGRNALQLFVDGVFCPAGNDNVYSENGTIGTYSSSIIINVDIPAGSVIFVHVANTATEQPAPDAVIGTDVTARAQSAAAAQQVAIAMAQLETLTSKADTAKTTADAANLAANNAIPKLCIDNSVTSTATDKVASASAVKTAYDLAKSANELALQNKTLVATEKEFPALTTKALATSTLTVPAYIVGKNYIQLWLDGVYCKEGASGVWSEVGSAGQSSTVIKFNLDIPIGSVIMVRVWSKPV